MFKKILLFALILIPTITFAQESQRIAYFNSAEVITAMPEYAAMSDSLQRQADIFRAEMEVLNEEYTKKVTAFQQQQDTLVESIRVRRLQEIQDLDERAQTFQMQARQSAEQLQQSLFVPIQEKVMKAVSDVGTENQYTYILDAGSLLYVSPQGLDATSLVKKKLGLQ